MKKRILAMLLAAMLMVSLLPVSALAAEESAEKEKRLVGFTIYVNDEYDRGTTIKYDDRGKVETIEDDYVDESYYDTTTSFDYSYFPAIQLEGSNYFLSEQVETSDYEILTKRYIYDDWGRLTEIWQQSNWDSSNSYSFEYNESNQLVRMGDSRVTTEYFYDDSGMMTKAVRENEWDPYGDITTYEYDSDNRLIKTISATTFNGKIKDELFETNYSYEYAPLVLRNSGSFDSIWYYFQDAAPIGLSIPVLSYIGYSESALIWNGKVNSVIFDEDGYVTDIYGYKYGGSDDSVHCELRWELTVKPYDGPTSGKCGENVYWNFDETTGTLTFSGEGNMTSSNDGYPWYEFRHLIKSIIIEKGVTSIAAKAFLDCVELENVVIPDGVTYIGLATFHSCVKLKKITLPNSVKSIGIYAFAWCFNLKEITIPCNLTKINSDAFEYCYNLRTVNYAGSEAQWEQVEIGENNDYFIRLIPVFDYKPNLDEDKCGHKISVPINGVDATCTEEGLTDGAKCSVCGEVLKEQTAIPAIGHSEVIDAAVAATCTESGLTEGKHCSVCDAVIVAQKEVPAKGHVEVVDKAVAASCTKTGLTEGSHCSKCNEVLTAQEVVPALGHKFSGGKCSVCGAKDPNYVEPTPTPPAVTPTPPAGNNPFTDVPNDAWYAAPVLWAKANNVTGGTSATTFGPDDGCTRAQVVTFLWAANGKPEPKSMNNPFSDVADDAWYLKPVLWAVEQGITGGVAEGKFGPEQTCTRAQIATFLYAAAGKPEVRGGSTFSDVADSDWFAKPVIWAAENEVTGGIGDGKFGPNNTCTRAQVVTFLYKVYGNN